MPLESSFFSDVVTRVQIEPVPDLSEKIPAAQSRNADNLAPVLTQVALATIVNMRAPVTAFTGTASSHRMASCGILRRPCVGFAH